MTPTSWTYSQPAHFFIEEAFAHAAARCVVHTFDQVNGANQLVFRYELIEWR